MTMTKNYHYQHSSRYTLNYTSMTKQKFLEAV